jgi:hypothetical protein
MPVCIHSVLHLHHFSEERIPPFLSPIHPLPHLSQPPNHAENFQRDLTIPSGSQVALFFAAGAAKHLSLRQVRQLVQVLRDPMNGNTCIAYF